MGRVLALVIGKGDDARTLESLVYITCRTSQVDKKALVAQVLYKNQMNHKVHLFKNVENKT